jgi:hypothetical protein
VEVLHIRIKERFCFVCYTSPTSGHKCTKHYERTRDGIEVASLLNILIVLFVSEVILHKVSWCWGRRTYQGVVTGKPYDPSISVTKLEHTGHVQKRIGARLRGLVKEKTGSNLHNGKPLGGKSHLTQSEIDKLQNYYGLTIRENVNYLEAIKRAVWAVNVYKLSMNEKPQNCLRPSGDGIREPCQSRTCLSTQVFFTGCCYRCN